MQLQYRKPDPGRSTSYSVMIKVLPSSGPITDGEYIDIYNNVDTCGPF